MQMGDNPISLTYAFKQDGEKVTGTVTTPHGDAIPLSDGKIAGDKISFYVQVDMGGNPDQVRQRGCDQRRRNYSHHQDRRGPGYGSADGSETREVSGEAGGIGRTEYLNAETQRAQR